MTQEEFQKVVLSYLETKYPDLMPVVGTIPFSIDMKDKRTIYLDNSYNEAMRTNFVNWQPVVDHYLNALSTEALEMDTKNFEAIKDKLLPQIKHINHINFANEEHKKKNPNFPPLVYKDFVGDLKICLVLDTPKAYIYVNEDYMKDWGKSFDELYALALENLKILPESKAGPGKYVDPQTKRVKIVFESNDGYDAARLLLPFFYTALTHDLGSEFLVAMPARDLLFCMSLEDAQEGKDLLARAYEKIHHPISGKMYVFKESGLSAWEGN